MGAKARKRTFWATMRPKDAELGAKDRTVDVFPKEPRLSNKWIYDPLWVIDGEIAGGELCYPDWLKITRQKIEPGKKKQFTIEIEEVL